MICPRCNVQLTKTILNDFKTSIEVDYCNSCGGSWFENGELTILEKTIEPTFFEIRKIPKDEVQLKALKCPSCSLSPYLEKADHHRDKRVVFDYCPSCKGIWLDGGELDAIQKENWALTIGKFFRWLISND